MRVREKTAVFRELISFLWKEKLWWLVPLIGVMVILGILLLLAQGSTIAPFVYALF